MREVRQQWQQRREAAMAEEREGGIHAPKAVVVVNHGMRVHWYYGYYLPTNCLHLMRKN